MSYKSILAHVDSAHGADRRIAAAVDLAARFKAPVTGAFLTSELEPAYWANEGMVLPAETIEKFVEERRDENEKASAAARQVFVDAAKAAEVSARWLDLSGDGPGPLIDCARRHDLFIAPRQMRATFAESAIPVEEVAMASGGPVLVLPEAGYPANFGKRVLVAWKECREAARVLRDAWPFLAAAEEIHFVTATSDKTWILDDMLLHHLEAHGCKRPKLIIDDCDDYSVADRIGRHIDMVGADMIVLGLYGHSRMREFVLGGVSRKLLDHLEMPLLVSH